MNTIKYLLRIKQERTIGVNTLSFYTKEELKEYITKFIADKNIYDYKIQVFKEIEVSVFKYIGVNIGEEL